MDFFLKKNEKTVKQKKSTFCLVDDTDFNDMYEAPKTSRNQSEKGVEEYLPSPRAPGDIDVH